jgi:sulfur carrier protein ThiS
MLMAFLYFILSGVDRQDDEPGATSGDTMSEIEVNVDYRGRVSAIKVNEGARISDMLEAMKLYADAHIVLRGKRPVPITDAVVEGETLKVIKVASGG